MDDFSKPYDPKATEDRIYEFWEKSGFFQPKAGPPPADNPKTYSIHPPPPNVTGSLHMGHALNATLSDILIRYHRMNGYKTVWFPGTDHAGIATQNVVEKQLKKDGISRWDLGREKFIEKVWEWKQKYGDIIIEQLKKLGASCDWSRLRFTMDPAYAEAVKKAFIHYYEKGLIYRGKRVVNWCPHCQTSLSDLEIDYKEEKAKLYYIKYPLLGDKGHIAVATTRPETMLGDAAVAVNPKDERYKNLVGQKILLPLQSREIPIMADDAIDMTFGTGAVKVTPAHDILDSEIGGRHKLPLYEIIDERGRMTAAAGNDFVGLKVKEAREKVIQKLTEAGLIEKIEDYHHNIATCYRCGTTLEPLPSWQRFLKMEKLAAETLRALKSSKTKILPENFEKTAIAWLEKIKDWCISRQIWWGHRLPVFFCKKKIEGFMVAENRPEKCPICGECEMEQSQDVLDTWFSSALWPFAGLSENDLKEFYPSNVLITARDIINLWVSRMIFSGLEFQGAVPFPEVLIHATVLTTEGKRMSKRLATGIDPMELVEKYGADATRFGIIWQAMGTQDIHWDEAAVMAGKKFANKLWNIARFVLMRVGSEKLDVGGRDISHLTSHISHAGDQEILEKLAATKKSVEHGIKNYELGQALHALYDFIWHEFADKYIEASKKREDEEIKQALGYILAEIIKILHPFMPFITEEIWQKLPIENKKSVIITPWD